MNSSIPMLDPKDPDFEDNLKFNLWSIQSTSDYSNLKDREYNGQPWTDDGERGKQEVFGITMRDIRDCLVKAMMASDVSEEYMNNFSLCWDFSEVKSDTDEPKPTQYLLDHQDEPAYIATKAKTRNWRIQDIYKLNWDNIDPMAITQNLTCEIEKLMGIFPNINTKNLDEEIL